MRQFGRTCEEYRSEPRGKLPSRYKPWGYGPSEEEKLARGLVLCRVDSAERGRCNCYSGVCDNCCRWVDKDGFLDEEERRWVGGKLCGWKGGDCGEAGLESKDGHSDLA